MEQIKHLNLMVLGGKGTGKSTAANTILGQAFTLKTSSSLTEDVSVESGTVDGLPVTVYDTTRLFYSDIKEDKIHKTITEKVLQRCESGLSVFLLVIKADRFTEEERKTVEKIEEILGENLLQKTWILFTRGDELKERNQTINEFINDTEPLKKLIQKCDQRYHVFNNKIKEPSEQVNFLLVTILQRSLNVKDGGRLPRWIPDDPNHKDEQTPVLSPSFRRIVLLGKTGVGKSAVGNMILGQKVFRSVMKMNSVTRVCSEAHTTVSGRSVSVVDTPGFFDTEMKLKELAVEMARSVYLSSPGPHAFLIVFPVNMRFTKQEEKIPQQIEMTFGEEVLKYSIILFTHGDLLEEETIDEIIDGNKPLINLVQQCGERFHVFNNKDQNNREQVNDLLQKIDTMIEQNGGGHYRNQMFEDAHRFRQEEEKRKQQEKQKQEEIERVRKETEDKTRAEIEAQRLEIERLEAEIKKKEEKRIQLVQTEKELKEKLMLEAQNDHEFKQFYREYAHRFHFSSAFALSKCLPGIGALIGAGLGAAVGIIGGPAGVAAGGAFGVAVGTAIGTAIMGEKPTE